MAIAFDSAVDGGNNGGTTSSHSFSFNNVAGNLVVVGFEGDSTTDDITAVTYNNVAMTLVNKIQGARWGYHYYLLAPATGINTVSITSSSNKYIIAVAASWSGVKQSAQPDASQTGAGSDPITVTLTTIADNCWTVLFSRAWVAGAGSTRRAFGAEFSESAIYDSNGVISPPGSKSMTASSSGNNPASIMASYAPTVAGGAGVITPSSMTMLGVQ